MRTKLVEVLIYSIIIGVFYLTAYLIEFLIENL